MQIRKQSQLARTKKNCLMKNCKKTFKMAPESGLCKVVEGSFNQGNAVWGNSRHSVYMYDIICNFIFNLKVS